MMTLVVRLSDEQALDLYRILVDEEADEALIFLKEHVKPVLDEIRQGG